MGQVAELNVFQECPSSSQTKKIWVFASRHSMHRGKRAGLATCATCVFQTTQTLLKLELKGHWVIGRRCETLLFCFHIHDTFASYLHSKTATAFAKYRKRSAKTGQFIQNGIHCLICLASILARIRAVACTRAITALSSASLTSLSGSSENKRQKWSEILMTGMTNFLYYLDQVFLYQSCMIQM